MSLQRAVVIGASAGGIDAVRQILGALSADFPWPVLLVQHLYAQHQLDFSFVYHNSPLTVCEAGDKQAIERGRLYVAPPGYHLLVEADKTLALSVDDPVCYARPSIDVLFESAADVYGAELIGIILSGANCDGAAGLKAIKNRGGMALVQEPNSAQARTMPDAALAGLCPDHVAEPSGLGRWLSALARGALA